MNDPDRTPRPDPGPPVLEILDGAVELGGRPVLRGIDLAVPAGQVLAVLGANGSGKSTLMRAALGLLPTCRGEVRLFGTPLATFRSWHRIGYVPQRTTLGSVPATVREVVSSGRLSRRRLLRPAGRADREAVAEALASVGLADRAEDGVTTLSGGQQQRVLVARALAGRPDLLVLDEPFAGVDVTSQQELADTFAALVERGTTLVLVLHELGPVGGLIDRTVVMRDGRVAYDGEPLAAFHDADHHHHPDRGPAPVHTPAIVAPLERPTHRGEQS